MRRRRCQQLPLWQLDQYQPLDKLSGLLDAAVEVAILRDPEQDGAHFIDSRGSMVFKCIANKVPHTLAHSLQSRV